MQYQTGYEDLQTFNFHLVHLRMLTTVHMSPRLRLTEKRALQHLDNKNMRISLHPSNIRAVALKAYSCLPALDEVLSPGQMRKYEQLLTNMKRAGDLEGASEVLCPLESIVAEALELTALQMPTIVVTGREMRCGACYYPLKASALILLKMTAEAYPEPLSLHELVAVTYLKRDRQRHQAKFDLSKAFQKMGLDLKRYLKVDAGVGFHLKRPYPKIEFI